MAPDIRRGVYMLVRGLVFPGVWDVEEAFGSVKGSASVYLRWGSELVADD